MACGFGALLRRQRKEGSVYCHPKFYSPRPNQLYRNGGDGTFEDVSASAGIASHKGRAMGIGVSDYDQRARDIFVTNDNLPTFSSTTKGRADSARSGSKPALHCRMQVSPWQAWEPIFAITTTTVGRRTSWTALPGETYPLFRNKGNGTFSDVTYASRLAGLTNTYGGWGAVFGTSTMMAGRIYLHRMLM